jgi:tripeptidyl-peptidase-1
MNMPWLTGAFRYHVPSSVREHVDYITPGIALREVTGVRKPTNSLQKRFSNGQPPVLEPILLPVEELLANIAGFCSIAVTPQCIQSS